MGFFIFSDEPYIGNWDQMSVVFFTKKFRKTRFNTVWSNHFCLFGAMHVAALFLIVILLNNLLFCGFLGLSKMAESKPGLRKPTFTKVDQLRPGTSGHTLTVKVVSTKMVLQKGRADGPQVRQMRIAECLVGDETGLIIFTARNDQGTFLLILNSGLPIVFSFIWHFIITVPFKSTLRFI